MSFYNLKMNNGNIDAAFSASTVGSSIYENRNKCNKLMGRMPIKVVLLFGPSVVETIGDIKSPGNAAMLNVLSLDALSLGFAICNSCWSQMCLVG